MPPMKNLAIILIGFAAAPAIAGPDTDYPHRDWGKVATINMPLADATACVARGIRKQYPSVMVVPAEGGSDIDAAPGGGLFGIAHDPWLRLKVRGEGQKSTLRIFYRHPVNQKRIDKEVQKFEKLCLVVERIDTTE